MKKKMHQTITAAVLSVCALAAAVFVSRFPEPEKKARPGLAQLWENVSLSEICAGENRKGKEAMQQPEKEFYEMPLNDKIKARITGVSYPGEKEGILIGYDDLAYVHVLHYDFQMEVKEGELICNRKIAQDLVEIFLELYRQKYPIEKIRLVDEYGADDERSMEDNNTSCFNYRVIFGTDRLSNHSYGKAIDINPLYNPYIFSDADGRTVVQPENGTAYADRSADFAHKITHEDLCYRLFTEHGFTWGGDWEGTKDYQHFEKES